MDKQFTPEELKAAEEKIAKLEASGFFLLCGCSMGQPDHSTDGQKED
jgi:hypothetical protein